MLIEKSLRGSNRLVSWLISISLALIDISRNTLSNYIASPKS